MPALGERFRAAREARGLSLSDVAEQIRIRSIYLAAIEDENWSTIGAPVYVRGFLRTYARFLGLDAEEVVAAFNGDPAGSSGPPSPAESAANGPAPTRSPARASESSPARPVQAGSWLLWLAGLVAVVLVAFVVYNEVAMRGGSSATVAVDTSASPATSAAPTSNDAGAPAPVGGDATAAAAGLASPAPGASGEPSAVPSAGPSPAGGPQTIALVVSAPSWLRVTVDGNVSMEGTFPAGTAKTFHGKLALLRIGNAGGVEVYVDGKDIGKLGKSGDVIERSFTL